MPEVVKLVDIHQFDEIELHELVSGAETQRIIVVKCKKL